MMYNTNPTKETCVNNHAWERWDFDIQSMFIYITNDVLQILYFFLIRKLLHARVKLSYFILSGHVCNLPMYFTR